jgi:hypothetical protein
MPALFITLTCLLLIAPVGEAYTQQETPSFCAYPRHAPRAAFRSRSLDRFAGVTEAEGNNTAATAQILSIGTSTGSNEDVDVSGSITSGDVDYFQIQANAGEFLGIACNRRSGLFDAVVSVRQLTGGSETTLLTNDQHGGVASLYPLSSPFPAGGSDNDAALTYCFRASGTYLVKVEGYGSTTGQYELQLRLRKSNTLSLPQGKKQYIFLDFDGESGVNAQQLFSRGKPSATLSPLSTFLAGWSLTASDETAVIDAITEGVDRHFQHLKGTGINPEFDYRIITQDDIAADSSLPKWGDPFVSRVIVGGTIDELGISTIGIAEHVDPGNFHTEDTAVVLLDLLSAASSDPNSINSIPRDAGVSRIDAIGNIVGTIVAHEIGHFLGDWHTDNSNAKRSVIDQGGNMRNTAGIGPSGNLKPGDENNIQFVQDEYAAEGIASVVGQLENVDFQTAFALSAGQLTPNELLRSRERETFIAALMMERTKSEETQRSPRDFYPRDLVQPNGEVPRNERVFWENRLDMLRGVSKPSESPLSGFPGAIDFPGRIDLTRDGKMDKTSIQGMVRWAKALGVDEDKELRLLTELLKMQIGVGDFHGNAVVGHSDVRTTVREKTNKLAKLENNPEWKVNNRKLFQQALLANQPDPQRILGGRPTREGEFPHCVAVGSGSRFCCTGTLVAPRVVITAGHCFDGGCKERIYVGLDWDEANLPSNASRVYNVIHSVIHSDYDPFTLENDIAVLILDRDVVGVTPCRIATQQQLESAYFLRLAGFGYNEEGEIGTQRTADVAIATKNCDCTIGGFPCSSTYGCFPGKEIVAGGGGIDTCNGDSGGPGFIMLGDESLVLAGITSRATSNRTVSCGDGGIYVRADRYHEWVREQVRSYDTSLVLP